MIDPERRAGLAAGLALAALAILLHLLPGAGELLELDRRAVAGGELWRLVSGHWVHWSAGHLLWDAGMLALLAPLLRRRRLALLLLAVPPAISAGVWFLLPEIGRYRGLSGLDAALFAALAAGLMIRRRPSASTNGAAHNRLAPLFGATALVLLAAKVAWESVTGGALFVTPDASMVAGMDAGTATAAWQPVPLAHLIGGALGILVARLPRGGPMASILLVFRGDEQADRRPPRPVASRLFFPGRRLRRRADHQRPEALRAKPAGGAEGTGVLWR